MTQAANQQFNDIVGKITGIGLDIHKNALVNHAKLNLPDVRTSIKHLDPLKGKKSESAIVISAGPSVHRRQSLKRILDAKYQGSLIAVDGAYIACLKIGLVPDYVLTLDPHLTRIVRWFGDPDFEKHTAGDDYFARQDLDIEFRKNTIEQNKMHIKLVNEMGHLTRAIVASTAPRNVIARIKEARLDMYWWNPLVDNPSSQESITRQMYNINKMPCMNTGGTVGTAAWVFANSILKIPQIAIVGMDLGYYADTPKEKTQTFYELHHHLAEGDSIDSCFVDFEFPLTGEKFYIDPTYYWYRQNFLELFNQSKSQTYNCTEGGTLFAD
ncbi:MAG: motility associated factor glycosyltransferase family protein, partial [Candidatus Omnitrophica bacterium]|nr:motility associated factor glycosyltransferase family protein [Candidatus Omnitrophota bacterium]